MPIGITDPCKDARWDAFVSAQPQATPYHATAWAQVLISTCGYEPRYAIVEDGAGNIRAGLPLFLVSSRLTGRRLVCLPFSDHCWPLTSSRDDELLLLGTAQKMLVEERASYLEIRGWAQGRPPAEAGLVGHPYYCQHTLRLDSDPLKVRRLSCDENVRRSIRVAERAGVVVRWAESEADLAAFHRLDLITRRKHGLPAHPLRLLRSIRRYMAGKGQAFLLLAAWQDRIIAGTLFLASGGTLCYKYNASDPRYLEHRPNHLLMWKAIEHACLHGYRQLDLGRSNPEHTSLRDYKRRWGAEEADLPYYFYPAVSGVGAAQSDSLGARAMGAIIERLPDPLLEMAGNIIYPHLG